MRYVLISLVQTFGVILLAVSGVLLGRRFWRVRSRAWLIVYAVPLLLVAIIAVPRWLPRAELIPPFKWIMAGRTEFAVMALVCTTLLTTPLSRLPQRRNRRSVVVLMILFTLYFSVLSVTETEVTVGDPLQGLRTCTPEEFDKEWRRCAIVIDKDSTD